MPQANGEAERAVREAKRILSQPDPFVALLTYRSTPTTATLVSPAELLMGCRIRNTLPTLSSNLEPRLTKRTSFIRQDEKRKTANKCHYDRRNGARELPVLNKGDLVIQKRDNDKFWNQPARILGRCAPRSYFIETPSGIYRRNRRHLRPSRAFPLETNTASSPSAQTAASSSSANTMSSPSAQEDWEYFDLPAPVPELYEPSTTTAVAEPAVCEPVATPPRAMRTTRYGRQIRTPDRYGYGDGD